MFYQCLCIAESIALKGFEVLFYAFNEKVVYFLKKWNKCLLQ